MKGKLIVASLWMWLIIMLSGFVFFSDNMHSAASDSKTELGSQSYSYSCKIFWGEHALEVRTSYMNESVTANSKNFWNPVVLHQSLAFYRNDAELCKYDSLTPLIAQPTVKSGIMLMKENVIIDIQVLNGWKESYYFVSGYGGCNSCSAMDAIFSMDGDLLYFYYGDENETFFACGELDPILSETKSSSIYSRNLIKKHVRVYPPEVCLNLK